MEVNQTVNECWKPLFMKRKGVRYVIIMGGRGAGRSYVASQYGFARLISPSYFRCAIMRLVQSDIRNSIRQDIIDRVTEQGAKDHVNITDMRMEYGENSITSLGFKASSGERSAKLKSLAGYNCVLIEEAEEIGEAEFMQLDDSLRTVKGDQEITVVFCLNTPPKSHWFIKRFFNLIPSGVKGFTIPVLKPELEEDTEFLYFDYRSNSNNLDSHTLKRYEAYKNTNPEYYWHKIKGYCPNEVRGRIYKGWKLIDSIPHEARLVGRGLDFGWSPDPMHLCNVYYHDGGYILDQLLHGLHIKNETVAQTIKTDEEDNQSALTIADSAEPKSIEEISDFGVNIVGVEKGKGSVEHRIKTVGSLRISVTARSTDLWEGYETYAYKENKDGVSLGVPAHAGSDPMDASGYCLVNVIGNINPDEVEKQQVQHHINHQNFVSMASKKHGL